MSVGALLRHVPQRSDLITAVFRREVDGCAGAALMCSCFGSIGTQLLRIKGETGTMMLRPFVAPQRHGRLVLETAAGHVEEMAEGSNTYPAKLEHLMRVWRGDPLPITGGADAVADMIAIKACRQAARRRGGVHA